MIGLAGRVSDPAGSGLTLAAALAFYAAGCVLLIATGPTLGSLHAFAAFIVLSVVAALNQLLPVLTHAPVAPPSYVLCVAAVFALGFALLIAGFYGAPTFAAAAVILAVAAALWVAWNLVRLFAGREERQTRALMLCAVLAFAVAAGLGAAIAGTFGRLWVVRVATLAPLHAILAVLGFASLLIVAVSYRFIPMFAVAHATAYGARRFQWLAVAAVAIVASFLPEPPVLRLGLALLLGAAIIIGRSHLVTISTRLRKRLDISLRYASVAWLFGIAALALALTSTWDARFAPPAVTLGILGWLSITILGYAYKVGGFLAWQSAKENDPAAQLPALSASVNVPLAYLALVLLASGAVLVVLLSLLSLPSYARAGYDLYAAGGLCAVIALARLPALYLFGRTNRGTARSFG